MWPNITWKINNKAWSGVQSVLSGHLNLDVAKVSVIAMKTFHPVALEVAGIVQKGS